MQSFSKFYALLLLSALSIFGSLPAANSAKILAVFPYPGPSQYILVQPYLKALVAKGHHVTVVNQFPQKKPIENFRDIVLPSLAHLTDELIDEMTQEVSYWTQLTGMFGFIELITAQVYENADFQAALKQQFDLVIVEVLYLDSLYALGEHFKAPLIGISSFGADHTIDKLVGNISPMSFVPNIFDGLSDRMSFAERLRNYYTIMQDWLLYQLVHKPAQQKLYRQHFPHLQKSLDEIRKSFSLILLNQHFSVSYARPYVPNMIEVAGFHIDYKPQPLPHDLAKFINEADKGVIYFSMGSNIKSKLLFKDKLPLILKAFAALPQRVVWKYEDDQLPGKPANVYISKWLPQPDILAHPNVKLFITHGGLLSTLEAIHHAKPLVGVPVAFDQIVNVKNAVTAGYALQVNFLTFEGFDKAIHEVLHNKKFAQNIEKISQRYHDQPMKPMDKALYWTEYVLRHEGATHLRNAGLELNYFQLNSWDVILVFYGVPLLMLVLNIILIKKLLCIICGGKKTAKTKKQKKN